jgi:amino acid adenylation domain-containing protein
MTNSAEPSPSVGGRLPTHRQETQGRIVARGFDRVGPMSLMQQRMWYVEQGMPAGAKGLFNLCSAQRLSGPLQRLALEHAIRALISRHPALRTVVGHGVDGLPVQRIQAAVADEVVLAFEDLSGVEGAHQQALLEAKILAARGAPFDLQAGPLCRFALFKLSPSEHVFLVVTHHLISDGWSMLVISQDLSELYAAACDNRPANLPDLPLTTLDHAAWQADWLVSPQAQGEIDHWAERLTPLPDLLSLPMARSRPLQWSGQSSSVLVNLPLGLMAQIRQCARESETSVFTWLLASYFVLLSRLSGQHDLVVGIPAKGRRDVELAGMVGFFANTLPLRFAVDGGSSFQDIAQSLKGVLQQALDHAEVPFAQLVQRLDLPRGDAAHPVYQTLFSFLDLRSRAKQWGDLNRQSMAVPTTGGVEDLSVLVIERQEDICVEFCFNEDLFARSAIEMMARRYVALLEGVVAQPRCQARALHIMGLDEKARLLSWSQPAAQVHQPGFLPHWVAAQVQAQPQATALVEASGQSLDYGQVGQQAARISKWLLQSGWQRGDRVALLLGQGSHAVVSMLGALAAGVAYVPLDPQYPEARLKAMLLDSGARGVITVSEHEALFAELALPTLRLDVDDPAEPMAWAVQDMGADDAAYVLYTSGSTGMPKGVVVSHGALANFAGSMLQEPGLRRGDRILAVTTPSFDISVLELLVPLAAGAKVVMASSRQSRDGDALARLLGQHQITLMQATPSSWRLLLASGWSGQPGLRVLVGGEAVAPDLAQALLTRADEVWNMYGPTETTVWSTCGRLSSVDQGVHIGRPIANTSVWIVDAAGELCPVGVPGEIWIGGAGLAEGYLNQPQATAQGFVTGPLAWLAPAGQRLYRTGDLGCWREDGHIECLGRLDRQIKVRGVRIEPGDIEHQLLLHAQVAACVVTAAPDEAGFPRLVAYVVPREGEALESADLQRHLSQLLPESMVPKPLFSIERIPLLPNGKTDWAALQGQASTRLLGDQAGDQAQKALPLTTETQRQLAAIWQKLLGVPGVTAGDNFFELGGHSLLVMQSIALMDAAVGKKVNPRRYVFESLAQLAHSYDQGDGVAVAAVTESTPKRGFKLFRRKN